jgi:hypothetical protein
MSESGTNRTNRTDLTMSVTRGRSENMLALSIPQFDPERASRRAKLECRTIVFV